MSLSERLGQLEKSHVQLMTDYEVLMKENERAWQRNQAAWDRHEQWLRECDARCERDRQDRIELDKRIGQLVSGIGELLNRSGGK